MAISAKPNANLHWNYFIALEQDLERVSRYIEFCEANLAVYSIELAHLLFAAASEVDVLAKLVCAEAAPSTPRKNMDDYRKVLMNPANLPRNSPDLDTIKISVPRYALSFTPWENWTQGRNPDWWQGYSKVKHEPDSHFEKANLRYALNGVGALLVMNLFYYRLKLDSDLQKEFAPSWVTRELQPESALLRLPLSYYISPHLKAMAF